MSSKQKIVELVIQQIEIDLDHKNTEPLEVFLNRMDLEDLIAYLPGEGLALFKEENNDA